MSIHELAARFEEIGAQALGTAKDVASLKSDVKAFETDIDRIAKAVASLELAPGSMGVSDVSAALLKERTALASFARTGDGSELASIRAEMSVASEPDGGYLVMPALSSAMTKRLFDATPMRRLARVETITAGDAWEEPLDIGDPAAVWVGEKEARPKTATPELGRLRVPVEEIYALQPVTQRLIDDVGFDLGAWLEGKIADRFVRSEGAAFVSGDGVKKPKGFLTYDIVSTADATRPWGKLQFVPSGSASDVTADALRKLTWSLRAPYRAGSTWVMNSNTASAIDQLKDTTGQYLWRPSMQVGVPPSLLGYPVEFDETMPDIGAGAYPIAFGNWRLAYVIVDKRGIRFLRDPYSDKPNVGFYAYKRVGGGVANSEAVKLLKIATS